MRYCQIYDWQTLGRITLRQYALMMKAIKLQRVDQVHDLHLQAWLNQQIKETKKNGKKTVPYYKKFDQFFDYDKKIREVTGKPANNNAENNALREMILRANSGISVSGNE